MEKLKPCPFCGSTNLGLSDKVTVISYKKRRHVAIYCKKCNCYGARVLGEVQNYNRSTDEAREEACLKWNQRDGGSK